jgi:hypothetical protein
MRTLPLTLLAAALALSAALPAQAQWKWRDQNGRITASDLPPPRGIPDKDVLQRPDAPGLIRVVAAPAAAASTPEAMVPRPATDPALEARRKAAEQEKSAQARIEDEKIAQQRAENCRRARSHVSALEGGQRIARTNEKGEREILDDRARADEMRQAREIVASDCRGS